MPPPAATKVEFQSAEMIPRAVARQIDMKLAAWFHECQRPLNFRATTDPYRIMVSEFMLQQTTVVAVEPYFARFMEYFPDVISLARATEDEVMNLWAGLGYYRRARQLHGSAQVLLEQFNGQFPESVAQLQKLPGFGRYTAGAVISQAFDLPAAILETNTVRVFARLAGIHGMVGELNFIKALWSVAEGLVGVAKSPRVFNRAAMELGALVCRPQPLCPECPLQQQCVAYGAGVASTIVQARPRRQSIPVDIVSLALRNKEGQYAVRRIKKGEWHEGLWEFPSRQETVQPTVTNAADFATALFGHGPKDLTQFVTLRYQVTHHKIRCHVFHCEADMSSSDLPFNEIDLQFLDLKEISTLPMGSAQKKLLMLLIDFNDSDTL